LIRSSSHTLKYANKGKLENIEIFITEYRRVVQVIIDDVWGSGFENYNPSQNKLKAPSFISSERLNTYNTWLSARMVQCAGKQACAMLKAATEKRRKQLWKLKDLQNKKYAFANLQRKIDNFPLVKPNASNINIELDPRFIDFQDGDVGFDLFVRIKTIGNGMTFNIPIKHTKVSKKWISAGMLKKSIRITPDRLVLIYDIEDSKSEGSDVVAVDQGYLTVATLSDGQVTGKDAHGHDLVSIQAKLARCKKGSRGFARAQQHRKNYINWSINQLNFDNIQQLKLEKVVRIRHGNRQSRVMSHWTYTLIKKKLVSISEVKGFQLTEVPNEFRSQRCNQCGYVRKESRKGKTFKCVSCGHTTDADGNAASNLALDLYEIPYWVRQQRINRQGFYWTVDGLYNAGYEPIVRSTERMEHLSNVS
jgi:transposase